MFNVLQGRNQLKSAVFTDVILDHYRATLGAAERLRLEVTDAVREAVKSVNGQIRVNVTLQSRDGATLYYVRAAEGSLQRPFDRKTVAWLSVVTSRPMWWVDDWHVKFGDTLLVENSNDQTGLKGLERKAFTLKEQFSLRGVLDYKAFIVLPFPFGARGESDRARGAIHISFERAEQIVELIKNVDVKGPPDYEHWHELLRSEEPGANDTWIKEAVARSVIRSALHAFEAMFAPFGEGFFNNYRAKLCQ